MAKQQKPKVNTAPKDKGTSSKKKSRIEAQKLRMEANKVRRANRELTPWQMAKQARKIKRMPLQVGRKEII